ncbi:FMN-binding protein [Raineyella sp.]|uniref:FMN-binding protein n=1 Tax=Raineyella sp. TaxID=1911550 RepID=UPI002B1F5048|nr:FMN-binding protein [Raineyella sp.]MEA5153715.1 FMN-binding protein [Raineyella sp.]
MRVKATVSNGKITAISWVQLPSDGHSQRINGYAAPALVQEALQAQSAQVNAISGASYTSAAFQQSLQSALTQAGFKA